MDEQFLIRATLLFCLSLDMAAAALYLIWCDYPRKIVYTASDDRIALVSAVGRFVLLWILIHA